MQGKEESETLQWWSSSESLHTAVALDTAGKASILCDQSAAHIWVVQVAFVDINESGTFMVLGTKDGQ